MDLDIKDNQIHQTRALLSPSNSLRGTHIHSSNNSFPILVIAIIGILATAFLLVGYYIFVIKCCLNWHRIDLLSRFSFSRQRRNGDPIGLIYSPRMAQRRGLDESVIQSIPIFRFKRTEKGELTETSLSECAVCLNDFQDEEKLRAIPNCSHVFHVDCIDVWLQSNINCPLCRTSISISTPSRYPPLDQIVAPSSSPQNPNPNRDEDYVVIELGEENFTEQTLLRVQERLHSGELSTRPISPSPGKCEQMNFQKKAKRFKHVSSMGDECIDIRAKEDRFGIQPIRRSISMDSASDRQLYIAVQEILQQNRHQIQSNEFCISEGCNSSRVRRSFFSFGNGKGSKSAILPVDQLDTICPAL